MKVKKIDEYMIDDESFKDIFLTISKEGIDLEIFKLFLSFYFGDNVEISSPKFDFKKICQFLKKYKKHNFLGGKNGKFRRKTKKFL